MIFLSKTQSFSKKKEHLCNENKNIKRNLAVQNTNLRNLEKELVLIREK